MDILAGCRGYGLAGCPDHMADGMLIFRRCMLVAMLTEDAPPEKTESIVLGLCVSDNNAQEIVNAIRSR